MVFEFNTPDGPLSAMVIEVAEATVTIDCNHPLSGITLNFEVTIKDVRQATAEELAHGHPH